MNHQEIDNFAEQCGLTSWSEWDGDKYQEYFYKFAALAYQAGAKAERERCLYWCELGDHEGYTTHHIRAGTAARIPTRGAE